MLSVLIPTLNEERNLSECLDSVKWADDVVVVDSGSTDQTVAIAQDAGARVVQFEWNRQFPKKKNWALENVKWNNEWVLVLDADERITADLATEIQTELGQPHADGYFINRRFIFMGKWIRHCGYYPSWNLRLFKHRLGRYERLFDGDTESGDNEVHEHVIINGSTAYLQNDMLHYAYPDISTWVEKHNRYSNWEARIEVEGGQRPEDRRRAVPAIDRGLEKNDQPVRVLSRRRRLRELSRRLPFRPTLRFLYSYVLKRGFLDGYEGYAFCRLLATYEMLNVFKAQELRRQRCKRSI